MPEEKDGQHSASKWSCRFRYLQREFPSRPAPIAAAPELWRCAPPAHSPSWEQLFWVRQKPEPETKQFGRAKGQQIRRTQRVHFLDDAAWELAVIIQSRHGEALIYMETASPSQAGAWQPHAGHGNPERDAGFVLRWR